MVFTLPAPVGAIAFQNKAAVYAILFRAAAETLRVIAADPRHLGAEIGGVAVLHSWGQALYNRFVRWREVGVWDRHLEAARGRDRRAPPPAAPGAG